MSKENDKRPAYMNRRVVISGCSGGGKSTLLAELKRRGFSAVEGVIALYRKQPPSWSLTTACEIPHCLATSGYRDVGARILGRNMFGPICEEWPDTSWKG